MCFFYLVTLLLALITLSFARTIIIEPSNSVLECEECKTGVPYVPVDVIVTPAPDDDCVSGNLDVSVPLPPITPAPPPPC